MTVIPVPAVMTLPFGKVAEGEVRTTGASPISARVPLMVVISPSTTVRVSLMVLISFSIVVISSPDARSCHTNPSAYDGTSVAAL
jgi:hypothetical protein